MAITWRVAVLIAAGIPAVVFRPGAVTVSIWLLVVVLLVLLDVALAPSTRSLRAERGAPARTRLGESVTTELSLYNSGRRTARGLLRDAWQPTAGARDNRHTLRIRPGGRQQLRTTLSPQRRGALVTDRVTVRLLGPMRLAGRQGALRVPGWVRVLPAFGSRRHLPSRLARLRELDGRAAVRIRGAGTEFDSLREYVRGDDVRSIDWRASARTRDVVVRTWQPERDRRVVVVLDTGRTSAARLGEVPRLDSAMDAAMLLTALAARAGDRVDFVAGDRAVHSRIKGASHDRDTFWKVQEEMSGIQPNLVETDWRRLVGAIDALGRSRALVVLLTAVEPSAILSGLLPVIGPLTSRHRVLVASVRDPSVRKLAAERTDAEETYLAAAAELTELQRQHASRLLGTLGVHVLDADADDLPPQLADHYLALKARGQL